MAHGYKAFVGENCDESSGFGEEDTVTGVLETVLADWFFGSQSGNLVATGVSPAFAAGQPSLVLALAALGLGSAEAVGAAGLIQALSAVSVGSGVALGQPGIVAVLSAAGLGSGESVGQPGIAVLLAAEGVGAGLAWGSASLAQNVSAGGIAGAEEFGEPTVSAGYFLVASSVLSGQGFGAALVTRDYIIARVVKDRKMMVVAGANCYLYSTYSKQYVDQTISDSTGAYHFHVPNQADAYFIVTFKDGTLPLAGVSAKTLVGT